MVRNDLTSRLMERIAEAGNIEEVESEEFAKRSAKEMEISQEIFSQELGKIKREYGTPRVIRYLNKFKKPVAVAALITGVSIGVNTLKSQATYENTFIPAIVLKGYEKCVEEPGNIWDRDARTDCYYILDFRSDSVEYTASVVRRHGQNPAIFQVLKERIEEGTDIGIKRRALNRFEGRTGLIVNDEIEVRN